jgi:FkbH-like protein
LKRVAETLNLGLDSILLIDDSPFERAQVARVLPAVRTVDSADLESLKHRPDLNPPVASESRARRERYIEESLRRETASKYDDYKAFVRDCAIRVDAFVPTSEEHVSRCVELIQRSNQLNLSGRRLTRDEFLTQASAADFTWVACHCRDRFGDYGIVVIIGLARNGQALEITDLCISCRIAGRYVEQGLLQRIADSAQGWSTAIRAQIAVTPKNQPLRDVMSSIGFSMDSEGDSIIAILPNPVSIPDSDLVSVLDEDDALSRLAPSAATPTL